MNRPLVFALCLMSLGAVATAATTKSAGLTAEEGRRKTELQNRLCADRQLNCSYVTALLADQRLTIYLPPEPAGPRSAPLPKEHERNPYFTKRFGLLTPESLERCREFVQAHAPAFDAAYRIYGVPREVICAHLRIETDFGIPTKLSPNPLGTIPAIDRLVTLYVRKPARKQKPDRFVRRQAFALDELKNLIQAASNYDWDLFQIPGSSTGAIGLVQFEPSSFKVAVDGDGDGNIDLFEPADAIPSVAHYLVTRGWDDQPQHQQRAIYAYYGGHYSTDPNKYYMKAVLKYSSEMVRYLKDHPLESGLASMPEPLPTEEREPSRFKRTKQPID
jgi:membrane-bound lytic murein transglycosylase B